MLVRPDPVKVDRVQVVVFHADAEEFAAGGGRAAVAVAVVGGPAVTL